jgi:hypothetical protein
MSRVDMPVMPPVKPMLSKSAPLEQVLAMASQGHVQIKPKWDAVGFVALLEQAAAAVGR